MNKWTEVSRKTKIILGTIALICSSGYGAFKVGANIWDSIFTDAEAAQQQQTMVIMLYQVKLDAFYNELRYLNKITSPTEDDKSRKIYVREQILYYERLITCMQSGKEEEDCK